VGVGRGMGVSSNVDKGQNFLSYILLVLRADLQFFKNFTKKYIQIQE
jgi:hypothetical protein